MLFSKLKWDAGPHASKSRFRVTRNMYFCRIFSQRLVLESSIVNDFKEVPNERSALERFMIDRGDKRQIFRWEGQAGKTPDDRKRVKEGRPR